MSEYCIVVGGNKLSYETSLTVARKQAYKIAKERPTLQVYVEKLYASSSVTDGIAEWDKSLKMVLYHVPKKQGYARLYSNGSIKPISKEICWVFNLSLLKNVCFSSIIDARKYAIKHFSECIGKDSKRTSLLIADGDISKTLETIHKKKSASGIEWYAEPNSSGSKGILYKINPKTGKLEKK